MHCGTKLRTSYCVNYDNLICLLKCNFLYDTLPVWHFLYVLVFHMDMSTAFKKQIILYK